MLIKEVVKQLKANPETYVDANFGQGRDIFLRQLNHRMGEDTSLLIDDYIEMTKKSFAELVQLAAPYQLPKDYVYFLEFYGGLLIYNSRYTFSIFGIGPMVEQWYGGINSDETFKETKLYGFLSIGSLGLRMGTHKHHRVDFFLDLAGSIQERSVIGVGPWRGDKVHSFTIVKNLYRYSDMWRKLANSFTEWLELAVKTQGSFGYLPQSENE